MRFEMRHIKSNRKNFQEVDAIVGLIRWKTDEVTKDNWVSHLQKIADEYEVYVPTLSEVEFKISVFSDMIAMERRCYKKVDKRVYAQVTELKNLKNQLKK